MTTAVAMAVGFALLLGVTLGLLRLRRKAGMGWAKALLLFVLIAFLAAFAWMAIMVFVVGPSMRGI